MLMPVTCARCAIALKVFFHLLTLGTAFSWIKFAGLRATSLDRPSMHHLVWLRVLLVLSATAEVTFVISVFLDWCANRR